MGNRVSSFESAEMEGTSVRRRTSTTIRRPLSDRTNTIDTSTPSQSSSSSTKNSSSILKPSNLSTLATVRASVADNPGKTLVDQSTRSGATASGRGDHKVAKSVADSVPLLSTPSRTLKPSAPEGTTSDEVLQPSSVHVRRQSADKRKRKEKEISAPKSCLPAAKTRSKREKTNEDGVSKSCPAPNRKKRRVAVHSLPQDFIEQQKAYFAEVDAFQLSEEEVDQLSD